MMKKMMCVLAVFGLCAGLAMAQQDDFSDGFGSFDEPIGSDETTPEGSSDVSGGLEIQINADTAFRLFPLQETESDDFLESPLEGLLHCGLGFDFTAAKSEFILKLDINQDRLEHNPGDSLSEAYFRLFAGNLVLQAGLIKTTWGKGDSFHVLDVLNGQNFSDFINGSAMDRKKPSLMLKADILTGMNGKLELVFEPVRNSDTIPFSGPWVPYDLERALDEAYDLLYYGPAGNNGLYAACYAVVYGGLYTSIYNQAYAAAIASGADPATAAVIAQAAASDPSVSALAAEQAADQASSQADEMIDALLDSEDQTDLRDSQFGIRFTDSLGGLDLGFEYYYGFTKRPILPDLSTVSSLSDLETLEFIFPRIHLFGVDAAFELGKLNLRCELAYTLMENRDYVDTLSYTAGLDTTLALSNLSVNLQSYGEYKMKDVPDSHINKLALQIADSWYNDRIKPSVQGVYTIEDGDFMINAKICWTLSDELELKTSYTLFEGDEDTGFGQFTDNDFAEIVLSYSK
ncbi:MAG: hypothetical protein JW874_03345 [Spirochaetales bacterium]|nr:hypothetical protein [Spirochaetales bacterium]